MTAADRNLDPVDAETLADFSYVPDRDQALDHGRCFLCGVDLDQSNRTDEHVFPRWALGEFELYDQRMGLPNDTEIRYRSLKIPCCFECNSTWLSQLEDRVATAWRSGPEAFEALDPLTLGLWLSKIYYGLLFKDISLALDQSQPGSGPLLDPSWLATYFELHQVLQVVRGAISLTDGQMPASIFVFRTLDSDIPQNRFDFRDTMVVPFIAIRLGPVGLVGCLLDWGSVQGALRIDDIDLARGLRLHPMQFSMVSALLAHWRIRFNRIPKYLAATSPQGGADQLMVMPIGGLSGLPVFDDFEPELYAKLLAAFTRFPLERVWNREAGTLWNPLEDDQGNALQVDSVEGYRFEPPW